MSTRTRTERYDGLHPSQVQAACAADAAQGAQIGWIPTDQEWVGQSLLAAIGIGVTAGLVFLDLRLVE